MKLFKSFHNSFLNSLGTLCPGTAPSALGSWIVRLIKLAWYFSGVMNHLTLIVQWALRPEFSKQLSSSYWPLIFSHSCPLCPLQGFLKFVGAFVLLRLVAVVLFSGLFIFVMFSTALTEDEGTSRMMRQLEDKAVSNVMNLIEEFETKYLN